MMPDLLDLPGVTDPTVDGIPFAMVCAIEGSPTGDGRMFTPGALTWRDLPLTLKAEHDSDGVASVVGRIDSMYRVTDTPRPGINLIVGKGVFTPTGTGADAAQMVAGKYLRGNSLEACDMNVAAYDEDSDTVTFDAGTIMAVALTPTPAFAECTIATLDPQSMQPVVTGAPTVPLTAAGTEPAVVKWGPSIRTSDEGLTMTLTTDAEQVEAALVASAGPLAPPAAWFASTPLDGPTPLTLDDDGRVFGHIALWSDESGQLTRHIGVGATVPHSQTDYDYFHVGHIKTAEGDTVRTGNLTVGGGHAGATLGMQATRDHYDNVARVWSQVAMYEDDYGIAVAGCAMPDLDEFTARLVRATAPSGDWRDANGHLELVACCQVPTPGFQVRRPRAMVASGGRVMSLVASCSLLPDDGTGNLLRRLERLEAAERARKRLALRASL